MLRRSQYICVLALVNARFSILKKQKPTENTILFFFLLGQEIRDSNDSNFRETLFTIGGLEPSKQEIGNVRNSSPTSPVEKCEFHLSGMIADYRRNLGSLGKMGTLSILQICPRPSQTIGNMYNFQFSLVAKIWDSQETVKYLIAWYFSDNQAKKKKE